MGKRNIATDLQQIATILYKERLCVDISPLSKIAGEANKGGYNLQKLKIKVDDVPNNTRPNVTSLEILLNVQITETLLDKNKIDNPVCAYNFSIEIIGKNGEQTVRSSWHLDIDNASESDYFHPRFHLTYGGLRMKSTKLGDVLLLPTPRISYPPMDAVLGIDFVLSNFVKKDVYTKIRANNQYKEAVKYSQERLWKPYMLSLANHWCKCSNINSNGLSKEYHPTLVD
jgi:hypothetical protein